MSKPVLQHYIPKTYLRQFQIDNAQNRSFVFCIDFSNRYRTGVQRLGINDKVFKLPKYYTDNRLEDPYILEKIFAKEVEPDYNKIMEAIRSEEPIPLDIREKLIVWTFVSKMRNPDLRDNMSRIMGWVIKTMNQYEKKVPTESQQQNINEYVELSAKKIHLSTFLESEQLSQLSDLHTETLVLKQWKILKSQAFFPFWTNDNPGFSPNLHPKFAEHTPFHRVMELNHNSIIYYVLSPDYCLEIKPFYEGTSLEINALNMEIKFEQASLEYIDYINKGVFYTRHKLLISNIDTYLRQCIKRAKM